MGASSPRVSIIVPARNAEVEARRLLAALHAQTASTDSFEIIVVDDASSDATAEQVRADPLARLIELPAAVGPYPARNVAARTARGDLLAFTDADCIPAPDWIEQGVAAFGPAEVDLIAGAIRIPLGDRPSAVSLVDAARHLNQELYFSRGYGATANMWVRRTVFEEIGGFNEQLLSGGDWEFGLRTREAGKKLEYVPAASVDHPPRARPSELVRKGYRIGLGAAQQRVHAEGALRDARPPWAQLRSWLPERRLMGVHRLEAAGHRPGRLKLVQLLLAQHLFLTLPRNAGSLVGTLRARKRRS
jgi:glycosyltransferase involved in cell wall biosynthesis